MSTGETATFSEFQPAPLAANKLIFCFDYSDISEESIQRDCDLKLRASTDVVLNKLLTVGRIQDINVSMVQKEIASTRSHTAALAAEYIGKQLLKLIFEAVFIPLDHDEDSSPDNREIAYKCFHILAEYFENHGFAGIEYQSTRTKLIGHNTKNLVIFNVDDCIPIPSTLCVLNKPVVV